MTIMEVSSTFCLASVSQLISLKYGCCFTCICQIIKLYFQFQMYINNVDEKKEANKPQLLL
ncbi:hypothetical protein Hanom_Chr05g00418781 [Helianthus anomalus]